MAETALLKHKDVQHGALFDVVVEEPQHVVEPVSFSVAHAGHERAHVTTDALAAVAKGPSLCDIVGALQSKRLGAHLDRIEDRDHLREMGRADTQCLVGAEVDDTCVELVDIAVKVEPVAVDLDQLLEAAQ